MPPELHARVADVHPLVPLKHLRRIELATLLAGVVRELRGKVFIRGSEDVQLHVRTPQPVQQQPEDVVLVLPRIDPAAQDIGGLPEVGWRVRGIQRSAVSGRGDLQGGAT